MDFKAYMVTLLSTAAILTGVFLYANDAPGNDAAHFKSFMEKHQKNYLSRVEFDYRLGIFAQNLEFIRSANNEKRSFTMAVNKFADLSWDEFRSFYLMKPIPNPSLSAEDAPYSFITTDKVDWVAQGKVGAVKDQEDCGSCWAFAAIGAMQSTMAIKTNQLEEYSVQELVDCADKYDNNGCSGGLPANAYKYIVDNKIALNADYPYIAREQKCKAQSGTKRIGLSGYESLKQINLEGLINMLLRSPVAIGIEVERDLMFYDSGVYTGSEKCGNELNHGIVLTGFDATQTPKFFTIQNSWGSDWGEKGFARIAFSNKKTGTCGMINELDTIPFAQVPV